MHVASASSLLSVHGEVVMKGGRSILRWCALDMSKTATADGEDCEDGSPTPIASNWAMGAVGYGLVKEVAAGRLHCRH
jgi:hypothetical protein